MTSLRILVSALLVMITIMMLNWSNTSKDSKQPSFQEALDAAKLNPSSINFRELRFSWVQDSSYKPYIHMDPSYKVNREGIFEALDAKNYKKALKHAKEILSLTYLDIEAHFFAEKACTALGREEEANHHEAFKDGLMKSILKSGDGNSPETAYKVITLTEEWAVLSWLGYPQPSKQSLVIHEGNYYDCLISEHVETGEKRSFYFDISAFHKSE